MKRILRIIETSSDTELAVFLAPCQAKLDHADPEIRRMAQKALEQAREEQEARAFLKELRGDAHHRE
jgi:hypothetical protein